MNAEFVSSMRIATVDLDGRILRVATRYGSDASPPLVIFNGIGANLELVEPFVQALEDVSVIVFDIPGVGGSPAPLMPYRFSTLSVLADKLLSRLGHDGPVDVLGVSWGGALAQQFAFMHPARCRRLVLVSTSSGIVMLPGRLSVLSKLVGPRRYTDSAYLQRVGAEIYGGRYRHDPALLEEHSRHIQAPGGRGYLYQLLAVAGWTSLPWLRALRQATLVLHGNDDPIVPLSNAKILAACIRDATLHVVDDGHLLLITRAREVAPVVREFLRRDSR
ncbi:poly(3-hydroxyalkanoate) depolymerase [Paraburkholderia rhizosphaerae]|uniref:Poly(3-hydroxyalkanoate) depolymerase n=1 Tax=Paraburkholderia rhizosphaerae TaxID=480658 RepID=A0A4R8LJG4_9BURK|nr:poly(3-hydroxyalkanoate) depolymerase [Paraburkholderia rhizosphaerae]TDY43941.1 poly(3-hydroxyalkanoate) depolymerase [Paraburkholderia rhizosphaerae]